jgi:hypothetical protein
MHMSIFNLVLFYVYLSFQKFRLLQKKITYNYSNYIIR